MKKLLILLLILLFGMISCIPEDVYENDGDNHGGDEDIITPDPDKPIVFKDANLEKCIRNTIRKSEGEIKIEDVEDVEVIGCSNRGIRYLDGLERFPSLKDMSVTTNDITDVSPLKHVKSLKKLSLRGNKNLDSNSLRDLTGLEELGIQDCGITSLEPLKNMKKLQNLSADSNNLESIKDAENLTGLTALSFSANKVTSLEGIENLTGLKTLRADTNQLDSMEEVANLTELTFFTITGNYLTNETLPVLLNLVNLERLSIGENCISDFTVTRELRERGVEVNVGYEQNNCR